MAKIVGCQFRCFRCYQEVALSFGLPDEVPHEFLALSFVCFSLPRSHFLPHCFPFSLYSDTMPYHSLTDIV